MFHEILMTVKGAVVIALAVYAFAALLPNRDAAWVKNAPMKIFVGLFVIGMWGHNIWVGYLAIMLAIPIFARSRADAAALFCVATVAMPHLPEQIMIGSLYLIPADKYLFTALGLLIAFVKNKNEGGLLLHRQRFDIPVLIICLLEVAQARDPSPTATIRDSLPVLLSILLPYFLLSRSLNSAEDIRRFMVTLALAAFVMATVATVEARLHWLIYQEVEGRLGIDVSVNIYTKMRGGMLRAPASFPESTSLGIFLATAGMALYAIRSSFATREKWAVALGVVAVGLLTANSRGAFVALGIGVVAQDYYCRRYSGLFAKIVAGAGLYLIALTLAQFSKFFASLVGKGSGTESTADYRIQLLHRGLEEIHKHPLLGTTMKTALQNLSDLRQGEGIVDLVNGYINYGLTLGYPGIAGLLLVFVSLCLAMLSAKRKFRTNVELLSPAAAVFSVAAFSIVSSFFGGFGGTGSTAFYQMSAVGSALWALRGVAAMRVHKETGETMAPPLSGIPAMIAADRARAKARMPIEA